MFTMPPVYNSGDTIPFPFDTYDSDGASVTITGLAVTDIEVYKDGVATTRSSDNGYTLLDTDGIDFASTTGLHGFSIDTSDNSDAGFWADGSTYWVNVNAITVDGQTVRFTYILALGYLLRPTTPGRKLDVTTTGEGGLDLGNVTGTLGNANVSWVDSNERVDLGKYLGTVVTVSATTSLPEVDAKSISDNAAAADNVQANIGNLDAAVSSLNDISAANVKAEAVAALSDINLDHLMKVAVLDADVVDNSALAMLVSKAATAGWDDYEHTTDSLQAQRDNVGTLGAALTDLGGMSTGMKAEVNVEAKDVLNVDTITLLGQTAPPLAPTPLQAIGLLYKALRNRNKTDSTSWKLYADNETTVDQKRTTSDDGTDAIAQEIVTGP